MTKPKLTRVEKMSFAEMRDEIRDLQSQKGTIVERCFARAAAFDGDESDALRLCVLTLAELASAQNLDLHRLELALIHKDDGK